MTRNMICTSCPMGCRLTVEYEDGKVLSVTGNTCKNGIVYGTNEVLHPKRTLTTVVRVERRTEMLSVKSASPLPKEALFDCMALLRKTTAKAPVAIGDVILANIGGTGVDIVATKAVD